MVKLNNLIRWTIYSFSLAEQDQELLIYLTLRINNIDTEFCKVMIRIKEFCSIFGVGYGSWWFKVGDNLILFRWVERRTKEWQAFCFFEFRHRRKARCSVML